jgi:hypothetical protein
MDREAAPGFRCTQSGLRPLASRRIDPLWILRQYCCRGLARPASWKAMAKIDHRTRRIVVAALALWLAWAAVPAAAADSIAALQAKVAQLFQQGRYAEAIPLAQRALAMLEETLGLNHPRVAVALTWLAELYPRRRAL